LDKHPFSIMCLAAKVITNFPPTPTQTTRTSGSKVRNVVNYINKKYRELHVPCENVAVDESTIGFKGSVLPNEDSQLSEDSQYIYIHFLSCNFFVHQVHASCLNI
jgi:hypothetical protein